MLLPADARIVGIDGRGASGKSTLARTLAAAHGGVVVELDDFYRPSSDRHVPPLEHGGNYDLPRVRVQVLDPLLAGVGTRYQRYDWDRDALAEWHDVPAGGLVVVEGTYALSYGLRDAYDWRIWVEAPYDLRLERGLERDGEGARERWTGEWMPAEDAYVAAQDPVAAADVVVDGTA
jgi:uridine kinase